MKVSVYAATCPKCSYRAVVHSRDEPQNYVCALMSKRGCDGILGPWMFIAETDVPNMTATDTLGSLTLDLGGEPVFQTEPAPPVPPTNPHDRYSKPSYDQLADDLVTAIKARDYFAAESKRNAEAASNLHTKNRFLDKANDEVSRLNADLRDQIGDRDRQIHDRNRTILKLRDDAEVKHADLNQLKDEIRDRMDETYKLKAEISQLKDELDARQGDADHAKAYDAAMHDRDLMIEARDDEIQQLKAALASFDTIIKGKDDEVIRLKADVRDRDLMIGLRDDHLVRQGRMLDAATDMLVSAATIADAATDEAGKFHEALDKTEAALTEARDRLEGSRAANAVLNETIDHLRQDLDTSTK